MPQKVCSRCQKELSNTERALGEIQCSACFSHWVQDILPIAEPFIRKVLDDLKQERSSRSTVTQL